MEFYLKTVHCESRIEMLLLQLSCLLQWLSCFLTHRFSNITVRKCDFHNMYLAEGLQRTMLPRNTFYCYVSSMGSKQQFPQCSTKWNFRLKHYKEKVTVHVSINLHLQWVMLIWDRNTFSPCFPICMLLEFPSDIKCRPTSSP